MPAIRNIFTTDCLPFYMLFQFFFLLKVIYSDLRTQKQILGCVCKFPCKENHTTNHCVNDHISTIHGCQLMLQSLLILATWYQKSFTWNWTTKLKIMTLPQMPMNYLNQRIGIFSYCVMFCIYSEPFAIEFLFLNEIKYM